jgi:uncharacterized metal-binding protein YceD (DUF177 family)
LKAFRVNIIGLSLKAHYYDFPLGDAFFKEYGTDFVSGGEFSVSVVLDKKETFIEADFRIKGYARLVCDRSLEPFDQPLDMTKRIVFKYGEEETELSDEIVVIRRDRDLLDLGQYFYEFVVLEVPMKRLHPRFREAEDAEGDLNEGKMIYSSAPDDPACEDEVDPRWEQLKKLK